MPRYRRRWRPSKRVSVRRRILERGGEKCFLVVERKGGRSYPKYPVCNPRGEVTCQGLWAAFNRARMNRKTLVMRKARRKAAAKGCPWTRN